MDNNFDRNVYKQYLIKVKSGKLNIKDVPEPYQSRMHHLTNPEDFQTTYDSEFHLVDIIGKPVQWIIDGTLWTGKTIYKGVKDAIEWLHVGGDAGSKACTDIIDKVIGKDTTHDKK